MWRVLAVIEEMNTSLSTASTTLLEVLAIMDRHMLALQSRLASDLDLLQQALDRCIALEERDRAALRKAIERIDYSTQRIGAFTHPDEVTAGRLQDYGHSDTPIQGLLRERQWVDSIAVMAFAHSPDAVIVADDGGVIRLVNPATEVLTGYHASELHDQPVEILVPDDVRGHHLGLRQGYFADPRVRPMGVGLNLRIRHRSGREIPTDINLSPVKMPNGMNIIITIRTYGTSSHQ